MSGRKSYLEKKDLNSGDFLVLEITFNNMVAQFEKHHPGNDRQGRFIMAKSLADALMMYLCDDCPSRTNNARIESRNEVAKKTKQLPRISAVEESSSFSPNHMRTTRRSGICLQASTTEDAQIVHDLLLPRGENMTEAARVPAESKKRKSYPPSKSAGATNNKAVASKVSRQRKIKCNVAKYSNKVVKEREYEVKKCSAPDCDNKSVTGGVCHRHGAKKKRCSHPGCVNQSLKGGKCCRHGAKMPICAYPGCNHIARQSGVCTTHGAKRPKCSYPDCENNAVKGGICIRHGAKRERKACSHHDCDKLARKDGFCVRHYGAKRARHS